MDGSVGGRLEEAPVDRQTRCRRSAPSSPRDGTLLGAISRKVTTLLVADDDAEPTGKVKKAIEYGIAIRTKESFEREFYIAH